MAKWIVRRTKAGTLARDYVNFYSRARYQCGELRADTPPAWIISWVATEGGAHERGDFIVMVDGTVLALLPTLEVA